MGQAFSVFSFQFPVRGVSLLLLLAALAADAAAPPASRPVAVEPRPIISPEQRRAAAVKVIDEFAAHVQAAPGIADSAKKAVAESWAQHREDKEPAEFLTAGVAIICPAYQQAMQAVEKEEYDLAEAALRPLLADQDPYTSLHAAALLARALVEQDKIEGAESLLAPLAAREKDLMEKSFLEADVDFLLGYCQLSDLRYDQAAATLERFEAEHPDAPERLRLPARQMLQELAARKPEGLGEVSDLMVYAGRRLGVGWAGKAVQEKQARAIELLSKLIKEAEEQEKQQAKNRDPNKQRRPGASGENRHPKSPAEQSTLPPGQSRIGELHRSGVARPGEEWGKMPPEERERVLQSLRRNFPAQYRQLVEQYYKQLAKER